MDQPTPANAPAPPPRPARRRLRLAGWLGAALLAASAAVSLGAGRGLPSRAPAPPAGGGAASGGELRPGGFGFVDVEGGVVPLAPVQPGRVAEVLAGENAEVEAGAPIFRLDDAQAQVKVRQAKAAVAAAEEQLKQARELPEQHRRKVDAQKEAVAAARADADLARTQRDKAKRLFESRASGSADDVRSAEALVAKAEAAIRGEEAKLAALEALAPAHAVALAERDAEAKRAQLEEAELALKECTVRAPGKGKVLRLNVNAGEVLGAAARQPAVLFCPAGPRVVRAEIDQEFAGRVAVGQPATIEDDATAAGRWTGTVTRVSDWYTHRRSVLLEPMQFNDVRTLECLIRVDADKGLRMGQRVRVTLGN
jgi:multidrug resistance efflux pump